MAKLRTEDGIEVDSEVIERFNMMFALGLENEIFGYPTAEPKPQWQINYMEKLDTGDRQDDNEGWDSDKEDLINRARKFED